MKYYVSRGNSVGYHSDYFTTPFFSPVEAHKFGFRALGGDYTVWTDIEGKVVSIPIFLCTSGCVYHFNVPTDAELEMFGGNCPACGEQVYIF